MNNQLRRFVKWLPLLLAWQVVAQGLGPVQYHVPDLSVTPSNFFRSNVFAGTNMNLTFDAKGRPTFHASGGGDAMVVSNALVALLVANDTITSNGVFNAETTRNAAVSNALAALLVANDTITSNALAALLVANDTITSNGVFNAETARNAAVSNALAALLVANDTTTSNGVFNAETTRNAAVSNALAALLVANDTITSNALAALLVANDTITSNGVFNAETTRNAAVSNALAALLVANDTITSNGVFTAETTRNAAVSNALAALLVANDTITSNAIWASTTNLFATTNALYVAINGNDATAQRNRRDLPFRTLGAANTNAFTNDTIFVAPGTWNEKIVLRNMVNWHFDEGAIISATNSFRSSPTNQPGAIFDDFAGNTTNRITGYGRFEDLTVAPFFYSGVVNMTNASFITLFCDSAYSASAVGTASSDNDAMDGRAGSVFYQSGKNNKFVAEARLTRAGLASYGIWWRGGDMRLQSQEIVGDTNNTGIVVASDVGTFSGATNVQMFVRAQRITHLGTNGVTTYTDSPTIYVSNLGADVRSWINAEYIESVGGAAIHANAGKYYINAQKILGAINDDNAGTTSEAYITAEKLATDNLFLSKNQPLIVSKSSKPQFYNFQVIEEGGITNAPIITHSGNGSAVFNGGWITRTNTGSIYYHTGTGTGVLSSVNFMAKSGETSISNAAGTLVVEGSYYGTTAGTITFQPETVVNLNGFASSLTSTGQTSIGPHQFISTNGSNGLQLSATGSVTMLAAFKPANGSNSPLVLSASPTQAAQVTIATNGNVGIGTNSPVSALDLIGNNFTHGTNFVSGPLRLNASGAQPIELQGGNSALTYVLNNSPVGGVSINGGNISCIASNMFFGWSSLGVGNVSVVGNVDAGFYRLSPGTVATTNLYASGTVGIGTTSPTNALDVVGKIMATQGVASYATQTNITVVSTGITNTLARECRIFGLTGVSCSLTLNNTNTYSLGTITTPTTYVLQPNEYITGSSIVVTVQPCAF